MQIKDFHRPLEEINVTILDEHRPKKTKKPSTKALKLRKIRKRMMQARRKRND